MEIEQIQHHYGYDHDWFKQPDSMISENSTTNNNKSAQGDNLSSPVKNSTKPSASWKKTLTTWIDSTLIIIGIIILIVGIHSCCLQIKENNAITEIHKREELEFERRRQEHATITAQYENFKRTDPNLLEKCQNNVFTAETTLSNAKINADRLYSDVTIAARTAQDCEQRASLGQRGLLRKNAPSTELLNSQWEQSKIDRQNAYRMWHNANSAVLNAEALLEQALRTLNDCKSSIDNINTIYNAHNELWEEHITQHNEISREYTNFKAEMYLRFRGPIIMLLVGSPLCIVAGVLHITEYFLGDE